MSLVLNINSAPAGRMLVERIITSLQQLGGVQLLCDKQTHADRKQQEMLDALQCFFSLFVVMVFVVSFVRGTRHVALVRFRLLM